MLLMFSALENEIQKLEKTQKEAQKVEDLALKHFEQRTLLEQQIRELTQKQAEEAQKAKELGANYIAQLSAVESTSLGIAQDENELRKAMNFVQKQSKEKTTVVTQAQEVLQNEAEAKLKAEELARTLADERRDAQADVRRLAKEEQEAKKHLEELQQQGTHFTVHNEPTTVDVYEHKQYETSNFY